MKEDRRLILDINATNISCVYVKKGPNGTFVILKRLKESLNINEELKSMTRTISLGRKSSINMENKIEVAISNLIKEIKLIGKFDKKITVGIGDEFCSIKHISYDQGVTKHVDLKISSKREVEKTQGKVIIDNEEQDYRYFCSSLIAYKEFEEKRQKNGKFKKSTSGKVTCCVCYCKVNLLDCINNVIKCEGLKGNLVLKSMINLNYHLPSYKRKDAYLVIHTQDKKCTMLAGGGDGIYLKKFSSIGLEKIIKDIMENINKEESNNITKEQAKDLIKNAILTLNDNTSSYKTSNNQVYLSSSINGVIKDNLQSLIEDIKIFITERLDNDGIFLSNTIYFYGSGIAEIKGLKNYIESLYGGKLEVEIIIPNVPQYEQSKYCNITALVNGVK